MGGGKRSESRTKKMMYELIIKIQGSRLNDQRCDPDLIAKNETKDEEFFGFIFHSQSKRIDDQRCACPVKL